MRRSLTHIESTLPPVNWKSPCNRPGVRDPSLPQAMASVKVVGVAPVVGSVLSEGTVFLAVIGQAGPFEYSVE